MISSIVPRRARVSLGATTSSTRARPEASQGPMPSSAPARAAVNGEASLVETSASGQATT